MEEIWIKFFDKFINLWNSEHTGDSYSPQFFNNSEESKIFLKNLVMYNGSKIKKIFLFYKINIWKIFFMIP